MFWNIPKERNILHGFDKYPFCAVLFLLMKFTAVVLNVAQGEIVYISFTSIDKQPALRRDCTYTIKIVIQIGMSGVYIHFTLMLLTNAPAQLVHVSHSTSTF